MAYNSLLIERRKLLHERAGQALESMFAGQLEDHLDELAHHYSRSDNVDKAVEYLGRAGQQAAQRSAYADAINRLTAAIDLLQRLPESTQRIQRELPLQLAVGNALIPAKGFAAPEVERAYIRARELCERLGDPSELFPTLHGLWVMYLVRGELRRAYELAEQLLRRAQGTDDPALLLYALMALGMTSYLMGDFLPAREHLETAISLYDPERHRSLAFRYRGADAGVYCLSYAAWTLWHLGYPDEALKRANEAVALAQGLSHPFSLAFAESFAGFLRQYRRETPAAQVTAEGLITLSADTGRPAFWLPRLSAWLGDGRTGVPRRRDCADTGRPGCDSRDGVGTAKAVFSGPVGRGVHGDGPPRRRAERFDGSAGRRRTSNEEPEPEAEIHRLKGELLLRQGIPALRKPRAALSGRLRLRASRAPNLGSCARRRVSRGCSQNRANAKKRARCSRKSITGSLRASIPSI